MTTPSRRRLAVVVAAVVLVTAAAVAPAVSRPVALAGSDGSATEDGTDVEPLDGRLRRVHERGVTGENVTVGVVDVTGFDTTDPLFDGRVAAARSFETDGSVRDPGRDGHGTAAAAVVARTAPDADLYLASFDTRAEYRRAVEWLVDADVDVIVAPVSFYGAPGDGSADVSRVASEATRAGTVFVAPAGNLARGHWEGEYDGVRNGTLRFGDGTANYLRGGRAVTVWLSWDDPTEDYAVELYRTDDEGTRLVAVSQPYRGDDVPNERIVARLEPGAYFVEVHGPEAATGTRLRLSSPTHAFQYVDASGSVTAPASGRGVVAVGAYDPRRRQVEPFSSRGPTPDDRLGVDVVAPDRRRVTGVDRRFVGSSAAAPYAAGVAALVLAADPDRTPREVEVVLEQTARDVGRRGADAAAGHGLVVPSDAVGAARNESGQSAL
jgi:hypothetical protein